MSELRPVVVECATFDTSAAELALGVLGADEHDVLLAHAASCERCQSELDGLASAADRLLLLAREAEPPVGFESRVLASIGEARERSPHRRRILVAAAAVLLVAVVGLGVTRLARDHRLAALDRVDVRDVRSAELIDRRGGRVGTVMITTGGRQTLTMTLTGVDRGEYHCAARRADGGLSEVAVWHVPDAGAGTWAVPIDASLTSTHEVVVTESDGSVVATGSIS